MTGPTCSSAQASSTVNLHQGACVHLESDEQLYQVIGVDDHHDRCWLRRWPWRARDRKCLKFPCNRCALPGLIGLEWR